MKKLLLSLLLSFAVMGVASEANATALTNVALNKEVTLNGVFYQGGWAGANGAPKETVVDGIFYNEGHRWDQQTVFWNINYGPGQSIDINLGGLYSISSFILQADNNDQYFVQYLNTATNSWDLAWDVKKESTWGMYNRPNPNDHTEQYFLNAPIETNMLRITGGTTDQWYSVSEFQAYGVPTPAPEPTSMFLGLMGVAGVARLRRKQK